MPLIVGIEFKDITMPFNPGSNLSTSRTVCEKKRCSTFFSDKDKTLRSVSGIPIDLGSAISITELYAFGICCDNRRTRNRGWSAAKGSLLGSGSQYRRRRGTDGKTYRYSSY